MNGALTRRGWWVLALGALTLALGTWWRYPGLMTLGGAFTVLAAVSFAAVRAPAALAATRTVEPLEVPRYGECTATLRIVHTGRWQASTVDGEEQVGDERLPVVVPRLRPGGQVTVEYPIPTRRRGLLRVGPLRLHRHGAFGLAVRTEAVGDVVEVRVLPRVLPVHAIPPGARRGHIGAEERVAHGGTDLVGLREYAPGDDLRRLHWATSARTGTLMVREDADPAMPHLAVLLDDRSGGYAPDAGPGADFEDAVEVAASLVYAANAAGHPVRLCGTSGRLDVELPGTDEPGGGLLGALAEVLPIDTGGAPAAGLPDRDRDVVAVITGAGADLAGLVLEAGRAAVGVVLVVDPRPARTVQAVGPVLVLRGPRAEELLHSWNHLVSGGTAGSWR